MTLNTGRFVPRRVLVRVTCTFCRHEFEVVHAGLLDGCMFPVPEHEPKAVRFHGPAYIPQLAGHAWPIARRSYGPAYMPPEVVS